MNIHLTGLYQTRQELEETLTLSSATIYRWVKDGRFPKPIRLGTKMVRWKTSDIEQWLKEEGAE